MGNQLNVDNMGTETHKNVINIIVFLYSGVQWQFNQIRLTFYNCFAYISGCAKMLRFPCIIFLWYYGRC